jgi:hypothetical protein
MFLPATIESLGLDIHQGPRWVSVDDPQKTIGDAAFKCLHGNVYYSCQYRLAFGYYMVAFGAVSMTMEIDGPGMADIRSMPNGELVIINAREKLDFIWNCFFAQEPFIHDGKLHDTVEKAWSSLRKSPWDESPLNSYKRWEEPRKVGLEFIDGPSEQATQKAGKPTKLVFSRSVSKGSASFQEACAQLGKQRHFESRDLKNPQEQGRFLRILQGIVEQCEDLEARFPAPGLEGNLPARRVFYLPGPDG